MSRPWGPAGVILPIGLRRLEGLRSDRGTIKALSAILEDEVLAGDIEAAELRHNALVELLGLRGLDPEALL